MNKNLVFLVGAAAAAVTVSVLPAHAVDTITFVPSAVGRPSVTPNPAQGLVVDMETFDTAIPSTPPFSTRYTGLSLFGPAATGFFAGATGIQRVGAPEANSFRVDYDSLASDVLPGATQNNFTRNLNSRITSFFLTGTCQVCGLSNAISTFNTTAASGLVRGGFNGTTLAGIPNSGNYNLLTNTPISVTFGASGITGFLEYQAGTNFGFGNPNSTGSITFSAVPGPLPLAGAALAFGWSRKLRSRIKASKAS